MLIVPTHDYGKSHFSPLSLSDFPTGYAYIAASLKKAGHEVYGLNLNNIIGYTSKFMMISNKIGKALFDIKPDLIGMGGLCIDYKFLKDAMGIIRNLSPKTPVVMGGGIINHDYEFIFNLLKPDFCIIGEAEETIVKLADMLKSGNKDWESIDNLGYWCEEDSVVSTA